MTHRRYSLVPLCKVILFVLTITGGMSCSEQKMQRIAYDAYERIVSECIDSAANNQCGSVSGRVSGKASFLYNFNKKTIRVKYGFVPLDNYIENLLTENYSWYIETGTLSSMSVENNCGFKEKKTYYPASIQGTWESDKAGDGHLVIALSRNNELDVYIFGENWKHWNSFVLDSATAEYVLGVFDEALEIIAKREHKPFYPLGGKNLLPFFDDNDYLYEQQVDVAMNLGYRHYCKDGRIGLINEDLDIVFPAKYSRIELSDNGDYVKVWEGDKIGLVTIDGEEVIPVKYSDIMPLSFGNLEKGDVMGDVFIPDDPYVLVYLGEKEGVIDRDGTVIIDPVYDQINWFDKLFCRNEKGLDIIDLDTHKKIHIDCEWSVTSPDGYSAIKRNNKWGLIDDSGKILLDIVYDDIPSQSEGDYYDITSEDKNNIAVIKDGKYGIIDLMGNIIVPFEYDDIDQIPYGGYRKLFKGTINKETWQHDGLWGLYKNGTIIIPCEFPNDSTIIEHIGQNYR